MRVRFPSPAPFNLMMPRAKGRAFCCAAMLTILATPNMIAKASGSRAKRDARRAPTSKFLSNQAAMSERSSSFDNLREYIRAAWDDLTRSVDVCKTLEDVKTKGEPILYLPVEFGEPSDVKELATRCHVR